jgi:CHAT domain-containing protein
VLAYVPFAALRDAASGRYLVQDAVIEELPSAGALIAMPQPGGEPPASPVRATVFTPLTAQLPATLNEARTLRRTVDAAWFSGSRATEAEVRVALESPGLVHLATHAELNLGNPLFSRIQLAPAPGEGAAADGRLEVHEILELRIASDLVFLSGCETGLGAGATTDFATGEDYATLAHAFLYAGARGVIATLWRVNDRAAAELAGRFYRHYSGVTPADALALGQRELLADAGYGAPYFWAGYVLTGTGAEARAQKAEHRSVN